MGEVTKSVGEGQQLVGLDTNVTTDRIVDGAVTEGKIGAAAVTSAKLGDSAVATAKIIDGAVTIAKLVSPKLLYIGLYDYVEYDRSVYDF